MTNHRFLWVIVFLFLFCSAQAESLKLECHSEKKLALESGDFFSLSHTVTNDSSITQEVCLNLDLPENWVNIQPLEEKIFLDPGESRLFLFAIRTPKSSPAGKHAVSFRLTDPHQIEKSVKSTAFVQINERVNLDIVITSIPNFILSGQSFEVKALVVNTGNLKTEFLLHSKLDSQNNTIKDDTRKITLCPFESRELTIECQSNSMLSKSKQAIFYLKGRVSNDEKILKTDSKSVDIIPSNASRNDAAKYHTFPTRLRLGVAANQNDTTGFAEFSGKGTLDKQKKQHFTFLVNRPFNNKFTTAQQVGVPPNRYYLGYKWTHIDLYYGDGNYSITPLLLASRYGRGYSVKLKNFPVNVGGLYVKKAPNTNLGYRNTGAFITFNPNENAELSLNYLRTKPQNLGTEMFNNLNRQNTYSLRVLNRLQLLGVSHKFDAEMGCTNRLFVHKKKGVNAQFTGGFSKTSWYNARVTFADPDFIGQFNSVSQAGGGVGFSLIQGVLRAYGNYNKTRNNLNKDPEKGSATKNSVGTVGLSYNIGQKVYGTISANRQVHKDYIRNYGYRETTGRLSLGTSMANVTFQVNGDVGLYKETHLPLGADNLPQTRKKKSSQSYTAYTFINFAPYQQYSMNASIKTNIIDEQRRWTQYYGVSGKWLLNKNLHAQVLLNANRYNGLNQQYFTSIIGKYTTPKKSIYDLNFQWTYHPNLLASKGNQPRNQFRLLFTLTVPFNVRLQKLKKTGNVAGTLYKSSSNLDDPLANYIVRLDSEKTLTDKNGNFSFFDVDPGAQHLWVEPEPIDTVCSEVYPLSIDVIEGKLTTKEIKFISSASFSGKVNLYKFLSKSDDPSLIQTKGWRVPGSDTSREYELDQPFQNAIIHLKSIDGKRSYQRMSDNDGNFNFKGIPPGKWNVTVYSDSLPEYTTFDKSHFEIELSPSGSAEQEIKILPKERTIQFID